MDRDMNTRLLQRFTNGRIRAVMQRSVVVRVRPREPGFQPQWRDAAGLVGGALRVLQRQRSDPHESIGRLRAPLGEPVVVDLARLDREVRVSDGAELQTETWIHHRDIDALGVEHLDPFARVEARGVQVFVVPAAPEFVERLTGIAEPDETAVGCHALLDQALVVARLLVPAQADALFAQARWEVVFPQSSGLAQMAVGVHDGKVSGHGAKPPAARTSSSTDPRHNDADARSRAG